MAKDSDKLRGGFDIGETGGALSGLLADDEELDRRALWRLGTWAAVSVGSVVVALLANQSSISLRHEQSASADLLKKAKQLQLTAKESQNENRRLSSAIETLNSDRDRLYSRVAVLEQGLDSVTGAIARQGSGSSAPPNAGQANANQASASQTSASQVSTSQANASQSNTSQASAARGGLSQGNASQGTAVQTIASPGMPTGAPTASTVALPQASNQPPSPPSATGRGTTASIEVSSSAVKSTPAPVAAPVTTTPPAVTEKAAAASKSDKQSTAATSAEVSSAKPTTEQQNFNGQPSGSLMASKSMMAPPDPAAGRLIDSATSAKAVTAAPLPEVAVVTPAPKPADEPETAAAAAPELVAPRTEFGVDVGGANSIPGLRALWRGLLKSHSNVALTKLRPVIVIKENNSGLGMQLRLVAGPISDAAAAAKICASLTVSDRGCSTAVFEGQRLALGSDESDKTAANKPEAAKPEIDEKTAQTSSRSSSHRHYYSAKRPKVVEEPPKPEPSTLSRLFGKRE